MSMLEILLENLLTLVLIYYLNLLTIIMMKNSKLNMRFKKEVRLLVSELC